MTLDDLVASENERRARFGMAPLSSVDRLVFQAQQGLPCLTCGHWRSDTVRALVVACFLGLVPKSKIETLLARGMCCKHPGSPLLVYEPAPMLDARR
jgi:hypothetical protein